MMRFLFRAGVLALAGVGAKSLYEKYLADSSPNSPLWPERPIDLSGADRASTAPAVDTATGTDPNAKYAAPGYEDKSLGQAVNQDQQLVDRLIDETNGDTQAAQARFDAESAGSPALAKQSSRKGTTDSG